MSGLTPSRPLLVLIADDCRDCTSSLSLLLAGLRTGVGTFTPPPDKLSQPPAGPQRREIVPWLPADRQYIV